MSIFATPRRIYLLLKSLLCVLLLAAMLYACALLEPYFIEIKEMAFYDTDIPPAFDGLRIVFISDIHHGPYFPLSRLQNLVRRVNGLQADLVIFGGDYYQWGKQYILPCFEELGRIQAPLGKFGVPGNQDYWHDWLTITRQGMRQAGITLLDNQAEWLVREGQRIKLGGVGDLMHSTQNLQPTLDGVCEEDFVLLISHNPEYAEQVRTRKIDVVLSGHTHAGQITLFGLWAPFLELRYGGKYLKGTVETGFTTVIISHGVGMTAVPVRFCARPDIIVLTLKRG